MSQPNIVFVTIDALRYDFCGFAGGEADTPYLDQLAADNISFSDAYSTASWTAPSFKSMFTGQYPLENDGRVHLTDDDRSFVSLMQEEGYTTLGFPHHPYLCRLYGFDAGFDVFQDGIDFGNTSWTEKLKRWVLDSDTGNYARLLKSIYSRHSCRKLGAMIDDLFDIDPEEPFFAWLHSLDTHTPFTPPERHASLSRWRSFQVHKARYDYRHGNLSADEFKPYLDDLKQLYIDEIEYLDEQIGRLIETLKEKGLYENTAIVVTADHGEEFLEHGHLHHQRYVYEELTHVPLIIDLPDESNEDRDDITSLIDIGPTLLDIAKIVSDGQLNTENSLLQGESDKAFMHAAQGDVLAGRNPSPYLTGERKVGLRLDSWHYIRNEEGGDELFDLADDRAEQQNLLLDQDVPDDLKDAMDDHWSHLKTDKVLDEIDL